MARVDTLTAYHGKFRYLQRNNPLIEEQREEIKNGKEPQFSFGNFIELYSENANDVLIGKNTDRAISLSKEGISKRNYEGIRAWHLSPMAGKQGQPMTVVKQSTRKRYSFGSDSAALYSYNVFVYEYNENEFIAIFHRLNGSGCKSVFLETANTILKDKGLIMELELMVPLTDRTDNITATKVTLQYTEKKKSSDIADGLCKKRTIIRDIGINLVAQDNSRVAKIIHNMMLGGINKETAFAQIKSEVKNADEYNEAEICLKIGKRTKKVAWDDFEHIIGVHDISEELHKAYNRSNDFIGELINLSDRYYNDIIQSGEGAYE